MYTALKGKVYFLNRVMSAYRMNSNGSQTVFYKAHKDLLLERTLEFSNMMDRINEYTDYKYDGVIQKYRRKRMFDTYAFLGDRAGMRKNKAAYADAPLLTRAIVEIRTCCPGLFNAAKDFYRKIRRNASVKI